MFRKDQSEMPKEATLWEMSHHTGDSLATGIVLVAGSEHRLKMGRVGSSRGRGFPGRIAPGMRPVTETCRMSIADQLEGFQRSEETSTLHTDVLSKTSP